MKPRVYRGGLSDPPRYFCATAYEVLADGGFAATTKWDVTDDIEAVVRDILAEAAAKLVEGGGRFQVSERGPEPARFRVVDELEWTRPGVSGDQVELYKAAILAQRRDASAAPTELPAPDSAPRNPHHLPGLPADEGSRRLAGGDFGAPHDEATPRTRGGSRRRRTPTRLTKPTWAPHNPPDPSPATAAPAFRVRGPR
jgi:hypothetical protein